MKYIRELNNTGAQASGLLVLASYNWGEGNVREVINRMPENPRERNFWRLLSMKNILRETYDYFFSIFAGAVICEKPQLFGFDGACPSLAPVPAPAPPPSSLPTSAPLPAAAGTKAGSPNPVTPTPKKEPEKKVAKKSPPAEKGAPKSGGASETAAATGADAGTAQYAFLKIGSNPTGAQVYINGSLKGMTPLKLRLSLGKYKVRLARSGYKGIETSVTLDRMAEFPVSHELTPE